MSWDEPAILQLLNSTDDFSECNRCNRAIDFAVCISSTAFYGLICRLQVVPSETSCDSFVKKSARLTSTLCCQTPFNLFQSSLLSLSRASVFSSMMSRVCPVSQGWCMILLTGTAAAVVSILCDWQCITRIIWVEILAMLLLYPVRWMSVCHCVFGLFYMDLMLTSVYVDE